MIKLDDLKKGDIVTIVFNTLLLKEERKIVETKVFAVTHATIYTENAKRYYKDGEFGVNNVSTLYPCTKDEYFEWKKEYDEKHKTIKDRIREILNEE
jgi:hypothetical protein